MVNFKNHKRSYFVNSFGYLFKKFKFFKKLWKYDFYSFDIINNVLYYTMELFCEFYENANLDRVNWNSDNIHIQAKLEMDFIYKWWCFDRKERLFEIDTVLDVWIEHHVSFFEKEKDYYVYKSSNTKYANYLLDLHDTLEKKLIQEEEDCLVRLMKIKNFLWI